MLTTLSSHRAVTIQIQFCNKYESANEFNIHISSKNTYWLELVDIFKADDFMKGYTLNGLHIIPVPQLKNHKLKYFPHKSIPVNHNQLSSLFFFTFLYSTRIIEGITYIISGRGQHITKNKGENKDIGEWCPYLTMQSNNAAAFSFNAFASFSTFKLFRDVRLLSHEQSQNQVTK